MKEKFIPDSESMIEKTASFSPVVFCLRRYIFQLRSNTNRQQTDFLLIFSAAFASRHELII